MHSEDLLSIGPFAALARLSVKALRHYDDQGLLSPVRVDPTTGYRYYARDQVERAALIGTLRTMDAPLPVIRAVLDAASPDQAVTAFQEWWLGQERRHMARQGIGRYVNQRLRQTGEIKVDINTRTVPERKLAVIGKEVFQPELERFIMDSFTTLFDYAGRNPGLRPLNTTPEWPTYSVFHGPVSPDQSSLVEVCIVVDGSPQPEGAIAIKVEPEHAEAYATLTKAELKFPEILDAYAAVAKWVGGHGMVSEEMPSREVYTADVMAAANDEPVCDVAFPYTPE